MDNTSSSYDYPQDVIALKKALEWELSLDSRDLTSHAWYHGPISRQRADEIVQKEGDFLIRDCVSQPGNYVLSCKTKGPILHFVINKLVLQPETVYERVQYQFEDDAYDTIPDLITYYVGSGKPITVASCARIQFPCNRKYPLSYYNAKYSNCSQSSGSPSPLLNSPNTHFSRFNPYVHQFAQNSANAPPLPTGPRPPPRKQRSQSLTPLHQAQSVGSSNGGNDHDHKFDSVDGAVVNKLHMTCSTSEKATSADGIIKANRSNNYTQSLSRISNANFRVVSTTNTLSRNASSELSPPGCDLQTNISTKPPLKNYSSMNEYLKDVDQHNAPTHRLPSYHASGSDSGNGSGDSAHSSATGEDMIMLQHRGVIIKNPKFLPHSYSSMTLKNEPYFNPIATEEFLSKMKIPHYEQVTRFDVENFNSLLLPSVEFKPLDRDTLNAFKMMLCETSPRIIANHLTRVDIKLILGDPDNVVDEVTKMYGSYGLQLLTLEHGKQFRQDLIERTECLKLLVAVTIVTCQTDIEKAEFLNKWILIAIETKTAVGNLFAFSAIMLGLCMPQVQKLSIWNILRQQYTDSAFTFEAKLKPTFHSMNDCTNPQAPNTVIPHLLPYILLKDRNINDVLASVSDSSLISYCIIPWETNTVDFGFSTFFAHLESVRGFIKNINLFKKNANTVMSDTSRLEILLEEAFRTEFHIKLLWGSKGAMAGFEERHNKFEQVLTLMSDKFCGNDTS